MKTLKRRLPKLIAAILSAVIVGCVSGVILLNGASAAVAEEQGAYYGSRLSDPISRTFYGLLEDMDFKSGETIAVTDPDVLAEAEAYTHGDSSILEKFGAAVDSFRYDHSEYFYVNFDLLTVGVKHKNGGLTVELGAGRSDTYFVDGFTAANIPDAVSGYNAALSEFIDGIKDNLPQNATTAQKAQAAAVAVADQIEYSFCVQNGADTADAKYIRSTYGALKNGVGVNSGRGVCESFARLFKAAMDGLGETCVLVNGWLSDGAATGEHMWNLVKDGDKWLGVDPTLVNNGDSGSYNLDGTVMVQGEVLGADHFVDRIVSTSGYEMPFPSIYRNALPDDNPVGDGVGSGVETEKSGLTLTAVTVDDKDCYEVSYNGKNASDALSDGYYIVMRQSSLDGGVIVWSPWMDMLTVQTMFGDMVVFTQDNKTYFNLEVMKDPSKYHAQFGVTAAAPDCSSIVGGYYVGGYYSDEFFEANALVTIENAYENPDFDPEFKQAVYTTATPRSISLDAVDGEQPKTVSVNYSEQLVYLDTTADNVAPVISVTALSAADGVTVIPDVPAQVTDVKLGEDGRTVTFTFMPSVSYSHNEMIYKFRLENMICRYNDGTTVVPNDFTIVTSRASIVCNRVFGDGKLWVQAYGTPTLVDNSDLSVAGWGYVDGNGETQLISQSQRSQLALVVRTPQNKEDLEDAVEESVGDGNLLGCATYEIGLNICRNIASIPSGSYLKLSFGFPEGITADMEGVEFEVYHFKKVNGVLDYDNPEILNCVVTQYGITVTVDSFSPFVVVARKATAEDEARRGITIALNGVGGTVRAESGKPVNFLNGADDSVTYVFTPDSGYEVEYAIIGGKNYTLENNRLTIAYSDLEERNNVLTVGFVSSAVKSAEEAAGEVNAVSEFAANAFAYKGAEPENDNLLTKILICVAILVVVIIAAAVCVALVHKRNNKAKKSTQKKK